MLDSLKNNYKKMYRLRKYKILFSLKICTFINYESESKSKLSLVLVVDVF